MRKGQYVLIITILLIGIFILIMKGIMININWFIFIGLMLNALGTLFLAIPSFKSKREIRGMAHSSYTHKIRDMRFGLVGLILVGIGFGLQIGGLFSV